METSRTYTERFRDYFAQSVAQEAARSLSDRAQIEFRIDEESFTLGKSGGINRVTAGAASDPDMTFILTTQAADEILSYSSANIGEIGVHIAKLIVSKDEIRRVQVKFNCGFLSLFTKGYFGVLSAGGGAFAAFLASRGLNGMGALKAALKRLTKDSQS